MNATTRRRRWVLALLGRARSGHLSYLNSMFVVGYGALAVIGVVVGTAPVLTCAFIVAVGVHLSLGLVALVCAECAKILEEKDREVANGVVSEK